MISSVLHLQGPHQHFYSVAYSVESHSEKANGTVYKVHICATFGTTFCCANASSTNARVDIRLVKMESPDAPREQRPLIANPDFEGTGTIRKTPKEPVIRETTSRGNSVYEPLQNPDDGNSATARSDSGKGGDAAHDFPKVSWTPFVILADICAVILPVGFLIFAFLVLSINGQETDETSAGRYRNAVTIVRILQLSSIPLHSIILTWTVPACHPLPHNLRGYHRPSHVPNCPLETRKGRHHGSVGATDGKPDRRRHAFGPHPASGHQSPDAITHSDMDLLASGGSIRPAYARNPASKGGCTFKCRLLRH